MWTSAIVRQMPDDAPEVVSSDPFDRSPEGRAYWKEEIAIQDWIDAGAPSPMAMWLELQGKDAPKDDRPLTVKQAATRENVSDKTIRRWLPRLQAMEPPGAHKVGRTWRIVPAGLDALRETPSRSSEQRTKRATRRTTRPSATRWEV